MVSHAPRVFSTIRQRLEYDGLRFLIAMVRQLSLETLSALAAFLGTVTYFLDRRGRKVALANIEAAFGKECSLGRRRQIARASYVNFARVMLELFWGSNFTRENFRRYVEIDMPDPPPEGAAIYYCLHFGNFEWLSLMGAYVIEPSPIVMQKFRNPGLTRIFQKLRTTTGHEALPQENAMIRLFKFLKLGGKCGILTDLNLDPREGAVVINMFGLQTAVTPFIGVMINKLSIPVIPSEALPLPDGRWKMKYHSPIYFTPSTPLHEVAQKCWDILEPSVRKYPELWLWSYKTWRFKPSENADRYPFYANQAKRFDRVIASQTQGSQG